MRKTKIQYYIILYFVIGLLVAGSWIIRGLYEGRLMGFLLPNMLWSFFVFLLWPLPLVDLLEGWLHSILPMLVIIPLVCAVMMDLRKKKFIWTKRILIAVGATVFLFFVSGIIEVALGNLMALFFSR